MKQTKSMFFYFIITTLLTIGFADAAEKNNTVDVYRGESVDHSFSADKYVPMAGVCRILLVRHGETEWNVLGLPQGWTDIPLNEEGWRQAKLLADNLSQISVEAVYSSPLQRAVETANKIAELHIDCETYFDPALRFYEKNDAISMLPKLERKIAIEKEIQRQSNFYLKDLAGYHLGQNVVIITHGKVIKYIVKMLNPNEKRKIKIGNASMVSILGTSGQLALEKHSAQN